MTEEIETVVNSGADQTQQDDKAAAKVVVDDKKVEEKPVDKAAEEKPADDWRVKLAGGDEKELKRLARFASEADIYKSFRELEKKKSNGELKQALSKDATPEELTQWRKENGIPESADKYDLKFDDGLVIGENDKPLIDKFVASMHGKNANEDQVKAAIATYYSLIGEKQQAQAESDVAFKDQSIELLKEEWGGEFKKNLAAVNGFLAALPDEPRAAFEHARTPDGKKLGDDPAIIKWLAATAYEINPAASVMPSSVSNPAGAISDEIAAIEKMVGDKTSAYWKGADAQKNQDRYSELLAARDKINARS